MKRLVLFSLVAFSLLAFGAKAQEAAPPSRIVRVGIMSFTYKDAFSTHIREEDELLQKLPAMLAKRMPDIEFETRFFRMNDLEKAVREKRVDVFVASSGFYWEMRRYGVRDLATLVSDVAPNPNHGVAGVIFVRKDREDLQTLADLKGMTASGGLPNMFLAYQLALSSVYEGGFDPDRFFARIIHNDQPVIDAVKQVKAGIADAGLLRACVLESRYPEWESDFRIINSRQDDDLKCAHSTDLYPNWTIGANTTLSPELSKRIAAALLSAPPAAGGYQWSLTTDFEHVDAVFRALKTGPYSYLREWTLRRFFSRFWPLLLSLAAILACFFAHLMRVEHLVRRRTEKLREEMQRRQDAEEAAGLFERRFHALQRMGIVGELSTIFAHELRQPLAAAQYLADGISVLLRKENPSKEKLGLCCTGIQAEIDRMNSLVDRVRSYAKTPPDRSKTVNWSEIVEKICGSMALKSKEKHGAELSWEIASRVLAKGDALELELASANLIKNAVEAEEGATHAVSVTLETDGAFALLTVSNSGRVFSQDEVEAFCEPLATEKRGGLGLGISIVKTIAEAHAGSAEFSPRKGGGLAVCLRIPLAEEEN